MSVPLTTVSEHVGPTAKSNTDPALDPSNPANMKDKVLDGLSVDELKAVLRDKQANERIHVLTKDELLQAALAAPVAKRGHRSSLYEHRATIEALVGKGYNPRKIAAFLTDNGHRITATAVIAFLKRIQDEPNPAKPLGELPVAEA